MALTLAEQLASARAAAGLSYRDLAVASGLGLGYLHRLEHGTVRAPGPQALAALARALPGVEYRDLMRAAGYLR